MLTNVCGPSEQIRKLQNEELSELSKDTEI